MNEIFKKFETLINFLSNERKKKQCINDIVDIFEETSNSDVNIKSQRKLFERKSKILKET